MMMMTPYTTPFLFSTSAKVAMVLPILLLSCTMMMPSGAAAFQSLYPQLQPPTTRTATRVTVSNGLLRFPIRDFGGARNSQQQQQQLHLSQPGNDDSMMDPTFGIISTLARIDKLRKLEQRSKPRSRWTRLVLNDQEEEDDISEQDIFDPTASTIRAKKEEEFVYLLEPPNFSNPSCIIVFVGGAGLGSFPQVAYQEFLLRLSNKMNAAVITAPYNVLGLDHFQLAKSVGERSRRALLQCEDDPARLYSPNLPVYCIAHSLGCKLASIYVAATGQEYDGMGFIAFNNFGFARTISMAKDFAQTIQEEATTTTAGGKRQTTTTTRTSTTEETTTNPRKTSPFSTSTDTLNDLFSMAETFLGTFGVEFSPSPQDTERLISLKFDERRIAKTRLFVLDEDTLDDSASFLRACEQAMLSSSSTSRTSDNDAAATSTQQPSSPPRRPLVLPQVSALPGNHLAPVYFEFNLNSPEIPESAREIARSSNLGGGFESASFGSREDLEELVNEVVGFLLGRGPTRKGTNQPLLSSSSSSSSSTSSSSSAKE